MNRLQKTVNNVRLSSYLTQLFLYRVARILSSIPMLLAIIALGAFIGVNGQHWRPDDAFPYELTWGLLFATFIAGKIFAPKLLPGEPPALYRDPPPPPPPPPRATAAAGRSDDPSEATVIGRLDPKLRDILRQKGDGKPS